MKCGDVMKIDLECVKPTDAVSAAAQKMRSKNVGFLPVCDDSNNILGTITDRDIALRVVADSLPGTSPVTDMMTREAITCRADDDIRVAEDAMAKHQKSRIMVVDNNGKLFGVISLSDIAQREHSNRRARKLFTDVTQREARP